MVPALKLGIVRAGQPARFHQEAFDRLRQTVREIAAEELPDLVGQLESIKAIAYARLTSPLSSQQEHDELLSTDVAARRLGVSKDYLYRHHSQYAFTRRQGRKLLFSALGIDKHIQQKGV